MKIAKSLILAGALMSTVGCSSMMSGTQQEVKIDSFPSNAKVFKAVKDKEGAIIDRVQVGFTPTTVSIARKDGVILLEKEGYQNAEVPLLRSMNPWMLGNILLTSPLSTSIDTSTGASNEYDPGEYTVELVKK